MHHVFNRRFPYDTKLSMLFFFLLLVSKLLATLIIQKSQELVFRHNSKRQPRFLEAQPLSNSNHISVVCESIWTFFTVLPPKICHGTFPCFRKGGLNLLSDFRELSFCGPSCGSGFSKNRDLPSENI